MTRFQALFLAAVVLGHVALQSSCHPPSPGPVVPPPPPPDGGSWEGGGERLHAEAVCSHLALVGCTEGAHPACVDALEVNLRDGLVDYRTKCLLHATSKEEVRACSKLVECK